MTPGVLYLIPNTLGASPLQTTTPETIQILSSLVTFVVESEKGARQYLKHFTCGKSLGELSLYELKKNGTPENSEIVASVLQVLRRGESVGVLSDAGYPCIADPGSELVLAAHREALVVRPLSGPTSFLLALAASGLSGQSFVFHGYLPRDKGELKKVLKSIEQQSSESGSTQVFMETPYRTQTLFKAVLAACKESTFLSVGGNLSQIDEYVKTAPVGVWRRQETQLPAVPTVFCLSSAR